MEQNASKALFLDVRTAAEVTFLGMPMQADASVLVHEGDRVSGLGQCEEERSKLEPNPDFLPEVRRRLTAKGLGPNDTVILICRSGDRSAAPRTSWPKQGSSTFIRWSMDLRAISQRMDQRLASELSTDGKTPGCRGRTSWTKPRCTGWKTRAWAGSVRWAYRTGRSDTPPWLPSGCIPVWDRASCAASARPYRQRCCRHGLVARCARSPRTPPVSTTAGARSISSPRTCASRGVSSIARPSTTISRRSRAKSNLSPWAISRGPASTRAETHPIMSPPGTSSTMVSGRPVRACSRGRNPSRCRRSRSSRECVAVDPRHSPALNVVALQVEDASGTPRRMGSIGPCRHLADEQDFPGRWDSRPDEPATRQIEGR